MNEHHSSIYHHHRSFVHYTYLKEHFRIVLLIYSSANESAKNHFAHFVTMNKIVMICTATYPCSLILPLMLMVVA